MTLPRLPTDSLYKFVAVGGLLLFGVSLVQAYRTFSTEQTAVAQWNASWVPVTERSKLLAETSLEELSCTIADAKVREQGQKAGEAKPSVLRGADPCKGTLAAMAEVGKESNRLQIDLARLKGQRYVLEVLYARLVLTLILASAGALIGVTTAGWGLLRWYKRVQRPLDQLTEQRVRRQQSERAEETRQSWGRILTFTIWGTSAAALALLALFLWEAFPGADGQTLAAWFQAVGSIAAIVVAFWVGQQQSNAALQAVADQQRERRDSIVAVAGAAVEHARRIGNALEQDSLGHAAIYNVYDQTIVDGMVHALTAAPVHEVGSAAGVIAFLALRDQFAFLGVQMKEYLDGPWGHKELRKAIESCGDDREAQRVTIQSGEDVLKKNVRLRLDQIQRFHNELVTSVERV